MSESNAKVKESQAGCKFARFDAPRLDPDFSNLIRAGLSTRHGISSYIITLGDHSWCAQSRQCLAEWSAVRCAWCGEAVASAFLDDGAAVHFEIVSDESNLPCAELTQPHHCAPMAEAEKPADELAAFLNAMESEA
ncbi:MAG: hypothetical protein ABSA80_00360 [Terriglobales bacterium]|jgi:hypothetical protein